MNDQDKRDVQVLDAVVRLYIETGKPVSSGLVARLLRGAYSPATIRSVMQRLERDGYLAQPHTSAGRLPTDRGYRAFVDGVLRYWPLDRVETSRQMRQRVVADLQRSIGGPALVKVLATLLSGLTRNIGIILGPSWGSARTLRLEIYPKEARRVQLVLILETGAVRSTHVVLPEETPRAVLEEAGRLLSERVSGRTVDEIRSGVLSGLRISSAPANRCATDLAERGRDLFEGLEEGEIELEGVANVLDEPEFADPDPLKSLIRFLESPRTIRETLTRQNLEAAGGWGVWIGSENPLAALRPFSLVSASFDVGGRSGVLAVLGPRRMPYQRAFAGIDILRETLQSYS